MSTITVTITTQPLDGGQSNRGRIRVMYVDTNGTKIPLDLTLTQGVPFVGSFQEIPWFDGSGIEESLQADAYRDGFNLAFKLVGGNGSTTNLRATPSGNVVTIEATLGTFSETPSDHNYNGNVLETVSFGTPNNDPVIVEPRIGFSRPDSGSCTEANITFRATGDGAPFELRQGSTVLIDNWDGSDQNVALQRGKTIAITLYNSSDELKDTSNVFVPRKLAEGDFTYGVTTYEDGTSDILVDRSTVINFTTPLRYSLETVADPQNPPTSGTAYQDSNAFPGVPAGSYRLFIEDKYDCVIFTDFVVDEFQDATKTEQLNYFEIMEGQSIIFTEFVEHDATTKKNYFNTFSANEYVQGARHQMFHEINEDDKLFAIQFKSSYPYHFITMHKCDDTKVDLAPILVAENLGSKEKYDCMLLPVSTTEAWVYFQGGNEYIPDTTTVFGPSPYNGNTPPWVEVNQLVFINGTGYRILSQGYDSTRGGYFVVNLQVASEQAATIQVSWNSQDYNTYEFIVDPDDIANKATIIVEKANDNSGNIIGNPWVSELLKKTVDSDEHLSIQWVDTKNRAGIVNQSGIFFFARIKGEMVPGSDDTAETFSGDSRAYSLEQIRREEFEIFIEGITFKQVKQLNIASAFEYFIVNQMRLVCKSPPSKQRLDKSNLWSWRATFDYGENNVAIQPDETVYSPSTGVPGGGGNGIAPRPPEYDGTVVYKLPSGEIVKINNNTLVTNQ